MILGISITVGVGAGWLFYRVLFYNSEDFWDGFVRFCTLFTRRRRRYGGKEPPEDFEDESWSSGIRFFVFLALAVGSGYFAYCQLQKYFG